MSSHGITQTTWSAVVLWTCQQRNSASVVLLGLGNSEGREAFASNSSSVLVEDAARLRNLVGARENERSGIRRSSQGRFAFSASEFSSAGVET